MPGQRDSILLPACRLHLPDGWLLPAGSRTARAASGMATVGRRPPGHIAEGSRFLAGHGRRDRGRPRLRDAMGVLQRCGHGSETRGEGCICGPRPSCGGTWIRATRGTSTRPARRTYRDFVSFFPGRPAVRGFHPGRHPRSARAGPVRRRSSVWWACRRGAGDGRQSDQCSRGPVGTSLILGCVPKCTQGSSTPAVTTITLSAPVSGEFTNIQEVRDGGASNYSLTNPQPGFEWAEAASAIYLSP